MTIISVTMTTRSLTDPSVFVSETIGFAVFLIVSETDPMVPVTETIVFIADAIVNVAETIVFEPWQGLLNLRFVGKPLGHHRQRPGPY